MIEEEDEAQDEEDVPSLNRTVSANSCSSAHIEYANRGRVSNESVAAFIFSTGLKTLYSCGKPNLNLITFRLDSFEPLKIALLS